MENLDFNILEEDERLDNLSMEEIKGGLSGETTLCCLFNSHCNKNDSEQKPITVPKE